MSNLTKIITILRKEAESRIDDRIKPIKDHISDFHEKRMKKQWIDQELESFSIAELLNELVRIDTELKQGKHNELV